MALYRCSSGGGGGTKRYKSGSQEVNVVGDTFTISTGLTSIDNLIIHTVGLNSGFTYNLQAGIYYTSSDPNYFATSLAYSNTSKDVERIAFVSAAKQYAFTIKSISGGNVVCYTPSGGANYGHAMVHWMAVGD